MPFPDSPRVIYNKNPLTEVICQLTFPAILRIDKESPSEYQEKLREDYPFFVEQQGANLKLNFPKEFAEVIGNALPIRSGRAIYQFLSSDKKWKITLTRESFAISTVSYKSWEEFKQHFEKPLSVFIEEYKPAFFSRIGLRYVDIINKSKLNLRDVSWSELLKPSIAGELSDSNIAERITHCVNQLTISLDDEGGVILLNHGLFDDNSNESEKFAYLIDSDFSTEQKTEVQNAIERLDYFNKYSGRLFRWCITEKLHDALEPQSL